MILIGTDEGIYRWFEGSGWPTFHSLQNRAIVSLASPGAGVIAAVDREGQVFESVNNGQDWELIPGPKSEGRGLPVPVLLAVADEPEMIVLATKPLGLYRRFVGTPVSRPSTMSEPLGLAPALFGRARRFAAGAATMIAPGRRTTPATPAAVWSGLSKPEVSQNQAAAEVRALECGGGSAALWFAAVRGAGLWRSVDSGTTWQQSQGLPEEVNAVRTVATKPGTVVAATADGCRYSSDNGETWEDRSGGLENARNITAIEVKPDHPETLLAGAGSADGGHFALYESNNGGKTWTHVKRGFPEECRSNVISDIRYDPAAPENVIVALRSGELWLSRFDRAYWCPIARQTKSARVLCAVG